MVVSDPYLMLQMTDCRIPRLLLFKKAYYRQKLSGPYSFNLVSRATLSAENGAISANID